jgi:hypothetical protein
MSIQTHYLGASALSNIHFNDDDSDDDFSQIPPSKNLFVFSRSSRIPASSMTVSCCDRNIKGNTLLELVHDITQDTAGDFINLACEYEKDIGGALIPPPDIQKKTDGNWILMLKTSRDWFMTLGGWKGMMPNLEFKNFFLFEILKQEEKRFAEVKIFDNDKIFTVDNNRIHLPKNFSIGGEDITVYKASPEGLGYKTDLAYFQIDNAIERIKTISGLPDDDIARLQLDNLSRSENIDPEIVEKIPPAYLNEIITFLDFLNCLMFGIESSGLNAGLTIGLMTLDLIKLKKLTYHTAFNANVDGGFYPYACLGNNKGTYSQREQALAQSINQQNQASMKKFRATPGLSPVASKETITIKSWLEHTHSINPACTFDEQLQSIKKKVKQLIEDYFFPF